MFEWLFVLLSPVYANAEPPKEDLVGVVAAEAAYSALRNDPAPLKPKVPTKDCTTCKGTGRVPTGDSNNPWTKCPDCDPELGQIKVPKSEPNRYKTSDCPNGKCPVYRS